LFYHVVFTRHGDCIGNFVGGLIMLLSKSNHIGEEISGVTFENLTKFNEFGETK
jgi:hypothetical protein